MSCLITSNRIKYSALRRLYNYKVYLLIMFSIYLDITITLPERGKELALMNFYKYKLVGERNKDYFLRWRCTNSK
jgi:hypothetical protein